MWLEGKDDIYEKAYLVHCADQLVSQPVIYLFFMIIGQSVDG